jgi:hypothetical protein
VAKVTRFQLLRWALIGAGFLLLVGVVVGLVVVLAIFPHYHHVKASGNIGYGDVAVAAGTLILAVFTFASVLLGWKVMRQTQAEVAAQQRPVLIPAVDQTREIIINGLGARKAVPVAVAEQSSIYVPIKNIGVGPALDVRLILVGRNPDGSYSDEWGDRTYQGYVYAIGARDLAAARVHVDDPNVSYAPSFDVSILYKDLAGNSWMTEGKYRRGGDDGVAGNYVEPSVERSSGRAHYRI